MAEWLRRGLQILARRFDSGSGLHFQYYQCFSRVAPKAGFQIPKKFPIFCDLAHRNWRTVSHTNSNLEWPAAL
jgi:hypothetical protein